MAYGDPDPVAHKTGRIALLCATLIVLGFFLFLFKVDACKLSAGTCQEEFIELRSGGYANEHKCSPGAIVEVVDSPPAPKPGIMCHCAKSDVTPSLSADAPVK